MRKSTSTEASVILHWFSRPWVIEELLLVCCHGTDRSERSGRMEGRKQKMDNMQKNRLKTILTALPFPLLSPACRHLKGEMSPASFFLKLYSFFAFFLLCLYPHHLNTHTSLIKVDIKWKFFYFFFLKCYRFYCEWLSHVYGTILKKSVATLKRLYCTVINSHILVLNDHLHLLFKLRSIIYLVTAVCYQSFS